MGDKANREDLDWNSLSNPVPLDFIDAGFEPHAAPSDLPGSRSEMLPREESEALANAHDAAAQLPDRVKPAEATVQMPGNGLPAEPQVPNPATLRMPVRSHPLPGAGGGDGADLSGGTGTIGDTGSPSSGGTTFGANWPQEEAAIQDEFSRIRATMEADAKIEKQAKADAEMEEAGQRQRLEQWMENARKRLLKADEDLTSPSARIRIRKDHSPSLYRLAEMQKTIWVEGQSTHADGTKTVPGQAKPPVRLDPMATISVPTEQFLTLDAPAQPTMREQALARQAQQQVAQQAAIQKAAKQPAKQASAAPKAEAQNALTMHTAPASVRAVETPEIPKGGETAIQPMTREQALTRKVAQLRKAAEGAENTLAIGPGESPLERSALQYAIAIVVIVAICVLGIALFAATQAGLFDGLENRIPFLKPKVSAAPHPAPKMPPAAAGARPANPAATRPATAARPAMEGPPGNQPPPKGNSVATPASATVPASAATTRPWAPVREPAGNPVKTAKTTKTAKSEKTAARPAVKKSVSPAAFAATPVTDALPTAPVSMNAATGAADDGEVPAYAKPRGKAANLGEIILRASVQAATNIDRENLLEMYNRYALGFPGLSGEVVIGLTVDPSGRILEGSVASSSTGVDAFDQELLRKVLDWRLRAFPESRPKFITVPFLFPLQGH